MKVRAETTLFVETKPFVPALVRLATEARASGLPVIEWRVSPVGQMIIGRRIDRDHPLLLSTPAMWSATLPFVGLLGAPLVVDPDLDLRQAQAVLRRETVNVEPSPVAVA